MKMSILNAGISKGKKKSICLKKLSTRTNAGYKVIENLKHYQENPHTSGEVEKLLSQNIFVCGYFVAYPSISSATEPSSSVTMIICLSSNFSSSGLFAV